MIDDRVRRPGGDLSRTRSFRSRIFLAILAVALVPTVVALVGGTLLLREIGATSGTLGPWDAVASSGGELIDAATEAAPDDPAVEAAAERHGDALSASVRQSRLYTVVAARLMALLPLAAVTAALLVAGLAAWTAGRISTSFAAPIRELVDWTERIGRGEALPAGTELPGRATEFDRLRRSLRGMAADLAEARDREVESARLRAWTEMARRVAHELKNPLTPMRMSAATLARSDDPTVRDAAEMLLEEVARLDETARTFAQFGRLPEGPPAPVDLVELLTGLVERHDGHPVPVELAAPAELPLIDGHLDLLERAFRNLVVNAQEAVRESGGTLVRVEAGRTAGGLSVTVSDDGPGVRPDLLDRIWLPDVTTRRRGTGLGLPLVKQAAEAHGGDVAVRNLDEGGAEFRIDLPLPPSGETPVARRA